MKISVVLPTYNRLDRLQRVLRGLAQQTMPLDQFEVIVVSDGSTDGTDAYLENLLAVDGRTPLQLTAVFQPNQGVAATRNHGIRYANSPLILFIDDDVMPASHLLAAHWDAHQQYGPDAIVMGPMLTPDDFDMAPWVQWEQAMLMKQYDDMQAGRWQPTARQFYTGNTSLARCHLEAVGGFDAAFRRAEDVELAYRLAQHGLCFYFEANAVGYHYAERSFNAWQEIPYVYGRNDVIFTHDKGQAWLLPTIFKEFRGRHPFIRGLAKLCLDRQWLSQTVIRGLKETAVFAHKLGSSPIPRMAYSGIFNLRHYQGIADELGGRSQFFTALTTNPTDAPELHDFYPAKSNKVSLQESQ